MSTPRYLPYEVPPPPAGRRRPSGWWFVLAIGLITGGVCVGVILVVLGVRGFLATDATVDVDGRPHSVTVGTSGDRILWVDRTTSDTSCEFVDKESGETLELHEPHGSYTRQVGELEQYGAWTFDPGSGDLTVTCSPELPTVVEVGPSPDIGGFLGGLPLGILLPFLLGGVGFLMLIVVGALFATGRPRKEPA